MLAESDLDAVDLRILDALQTNGRATFSELAALVGLGSSAVHDRVKWLEARGIIRDYTARLDTKQLGFELGAFVSAFTTPDAIYEEVHAAVATLPEVGEVHSVAGEESLVLKVMTRSTAHLDDFLSRLKAIKGIARTKTTVVLSTPFERAGVSLLSRSASETPALNLRAISR